MIVMLLNKDSWNIIEKESPNSFKKFMDYIDDFKASCNWGELFNQGYEKFYWVDPNTVSKGGEQNIL